MNPIFSDIGEHILLTVEGQLTNNEVSDDDECASTSPKSD